jgi:hypothetical protein
VHYLSTHFDDCDSLSEKTKAKTRPAKGEADRTARRARAQAELQATQLEEERERAEKELARARMAELRAQVDEMDRYAAEQRQREYDEWNRAYDRRQEAMEQLRALAREPLPVVPMTAHERAELQAELDAALAWGEQGGRRQGLFFHNGRLWDPSRF